MKKFSCSNYYSWGPNGPQVIRTPGARQRNIFNVPCWGLNRASVCMKNHGFGRALYLKREFAIEITPVQCIIWNSLESGLLSKK